MRLMHTKNGLALSVTICVMASGLGVFADSTAVGRVSRSVNSTLGGENLLPNTTIFSGDLIQVTDGVAVVSVPAGNQVILGRDTSASFTREPKVVTVELKQGNVSMIHDPTGKLIRVKVRQVSVTPQAGTQARGDIAIIKDSIVISAKEGSLDVDNNGTSQIVPKGKTLIIGPNSSKLSGGGLGTKGILITAGAAAGGVAALAAIEATRAGTLATCTANSTASTTSPTNCPQ